MKKKYIILSILIILIVSISTFYLIKNKKQNVTDESINLENDTSIPDLFLEINGKKVKGIISNKDYSKDYFSDPKRFGKEAIEDWYSNPDQEVFEFQVKKDGDHDIIGTLSTSNGKEFTITSSHALYLFENLNLASDYGSFSFDKNKKSSFPLYFTLYNEGKCLRIYTVNYENIGTVSYTFKFNFWDAS